MRKLVLPITILAVAVFGFFWYVQPTYDKIGKLQSRIATYDKNLNRITKLQQQLNKKLAARDSITSAEFRRLNRIVPRSVDTVRLLIELDRIAARHGLSVQDTSFSGAPRLIQATSSQQTNASTPSQISEERNYRTVTVSFSTTGEYETIQNFLRDLERSSRLMDLTSFQLKTPKTESDANVGNKNAYSITLNTYWYNP